MIGLSLECKFEPALTGNSCNDTYGKIQVIEHWSLFDVKRFMFTRGESCPGLPQFFREGRSPTFRPEPPIQPLSPSAAENMPSPSMRSGP